MYVNVKQVKGKILSPEVAHITHVMFTVRKND